MTLRVCTAASPSRQVRDAARYQQSSYTSQGRSSHVACPVCERFMPLTKSGALRIHGPLDNRCTGSGMQLHPQVPRVSAACRDPASSVPGANELSDVPLCNESLSEHESVELVFPPDICKWTRILKRIPRAARHQAASKLARLLDDVPARNDIPSWTRLF